MTTTHDAGRPVPAGHAAAPHAAAAPHPAAAPHDVVVVGSGIVGLGAALAAVDRGLSVLVVDRSSVIGGSTVRNFGHLCLTPQSGEARRHALAARELWQRLARDAGFWLSQRGTLVAARHADELALLDELALARTDRVLGDRPEIERLDVAALASLAPVAPGAVVGGALLPYDLQVDPRRAADAIRRHLETQGVHFATRTSVGSVSSGRVETSRGPIEAGTVVVATNHDLDQLLPDLADRHALERCGLDMLRVRADLPRPLTAPLLTGWSLIRYSAFAGTAAADAVRSRLHAERPDLAAMDLNQMYTQLPDGSVIVGDSHQKGPAIAPFQDERVADAFLAEFRALFGAEPVVTERWQGVYASGRDEFVVDEVAPGVLVTVVSTGIGMTTGLGLAEHVVGAHLDGGRDRALDGPTPTSAAPSALPATPPPRPTSPVTSPATSPLTSPLTESLSA
ncbi:TIGR03364 family FAD-dependent oxidoreductase [Frigoribacterium sp. VKM Ac-1396]|uniref:TIGR03364 family FAD-dependent oxidoreductase n=1 Tax=Frigoribacterium sp. VKM Ac-1396 TaxID=2783821 RepID=UPI00188C4D4F|nr:TIGR03364 family FAD-dependent oxidoreductase [Frigoribacterium sp. VKM Ac-1396]MBF4600613.1 TIGR03364 family FAD-dependent oxidoreductase [Frigoribacterium sp. VKM Ac-1396]